MSEEKVNPYVTINNLYALYGKKCIEIEALQNNMSVLKNQVDTLNKELKELKDGNT